MKIVVLKFGGTSVGSIDRIKNVAKIIVNYSKQGYKVIVISSAMSGETNKLVQLTKKISNNFTASEYDNVLATGEQVACSLIAGRLNHLGHFSRSWLSWQVPIITSGNYSYSRITQMKKSNILKFIRKGGIPIIAGFQGINKENRITTIGRGGSDASVLWLLNFSKLKNVLFILMSKVFIQQIQKLYQKQRKLKKFIMKKCLKWHL